ncbi:hypothetical protein CR513_31232, partial [Mucuna pruriens]
MVESQPGLPVAGCELETEVNSTRKTSVETDLIVHIQAETNSAIEDQKQARFESILNNRSQPQQQKAKIMSTHLMPNPIQVSQSNPKTTNDNSLSLPPPMELKPLSSHLKYTYLDTE